MQIANNNFADKLELHYFFDDDSHSMDAFVRNKCEAELLATAKELAGLLGLDIDLKSEALAEGGLVERISVRIKQHPHLAFLFLGILVNVSSSYITTDRELVVLQKEESQLHVEKLRCELKKMNKNSSYPSSQELTDEIFRNHKIRKRRSNFYESLLTCQKITKVEWRSLDKNDELTNTSKTVERSNFNNFILANDDLEPVTDENATIEIIAPVLKPGKYKWRGVYEGESILFSMQDLDFKADILAGNVPFINGTCIDCVLLISRQLDECGSERVSGYTVKVVTRTHDEDTSVETPQGRRYKREKDADERQIDLGLDE